MQVSKRHVLLLATYTKSDPELQFRSFCFPQPEQDDSQFSSCYCVLYVAISDT